MRLHRPLPDLGPHRLGVFTSEEARSAGWSDSALSRAVSSGHVVRIARGYYVDTARWIGEAPEDERRRLRIRTIAALLAVTPAAASHLSSAALADLPTWSTPDHPCMTVHPRYTGDAANAHLHRATTVPEDLVATPYGLRTRAARTVLDIAREHSIDDAVVVGDAALARRMTDTDRLRACARRCAGWPGSRRANRVLDLLDARSESPLESISRLRLWETGLARPEPQVDILTRSGLFLGRVDFYWDEFGVAGEVDGRIKYRDDPEETLWAEKWRAEPMDNCGLLFVRWNRSDLRNMPSLVERITTVFARGAQRPRSERLYVTRPSQRFAPQLAG